jgi:hypothetical protein
MEVASFAVGTLIIIAVVIGVRYYRDFAKAVKHKLKLNKIYIIVTIVTLLLIALGIALLLYYRYNINADKLKNYFTRVDAPRAPYRR